MSTRSEPKVDETKKKPVKPLKPWPAKDHDFQRGGDRGEQRCAICGFGPDNPVHR
jgi:hypothetical protein